MLGWVGGAQILEELIGSGKGGQITGGGDDCRDAAGDWESLIVFPAGMAATCPTVLVVIHPQAAEFVGQALPVIAVAGHTIQPVKMTAPFELRGVFGKWRFGHPVRGW